ncbi:hypothetical protein BH23PLA1_BH23PLA1_13910 [soil metagenome]
MPVVCQCEVRGDPLASFCDDDLFCPQCGAAVAELDSPHLLSGPAQASPRTLWVYPVKPRAGSGRPEFRFSMVLKSRDAARSVLSRPLRLVARDCEVRAGAWFDRDLEILDHEPNAKMVECALRLQPALDASLSRLLPAEGASGFLLLSGNCGDQRLAVRVFNAPSMRYAVEGDGVQSEPPGVEAPRCWSLGRPGLQELTLRVWPSNCLLPLPKPESGAGAPIQLIPTLPPKSGYRLDRPPDLEPVLGPDRPALLRLSFDISNWQHDERHELGVQLLPVVPRLAQESLTFFRQAIGDLQFEPGAELKLESALYYGERIESSAHQSSDLLPSLYVHNRGEDHLPFSQPELVRRSGPAEIEWIHLEVEGGDSEIELEQEEARSLRLVIDLSGLSPSNHAEGQPLDAEFRFQHNEYDVHYWTMRVVVPEVRTRPVLEVPLAVDFGNTNTFAAVVDHSADGLIRSVLGDPDPETFPSALCLTDMSDPENPAFEIGVEALKRGEVQEGFLVRGMKRELARRRGPGETTRHVFTWKQSTVSYSHQDLIRMYLERVLLDCEQKLRHSVTHMSLSYPANFGPQARAQLDEVLDALRERWQTRYPGQEIRFHKLNADAATAVALGFVLDHERFQEAIRPMLEEGVNPFLVASFDFGGGSVDCSLTRFEFVGNPRDGVLTYRSRPLGIGGDEYFGGDNVTAAVYECLLDRLSQLLKPFDIRLPRADLGRSRFQTGVGLDWENTQRLWEAAEDLKRFVCRTGSSEADRPGLDVTLEKLVNRLVGRKKAKGSVRNQPLMSDPQVLSALQEAIQTGALIPTEDQIYDHEILRDLNGNSRYTVREQLERCVEKLRSFVEQAVVEDPSGRPLEPTRSGKVRRSGSAAPAPHFIVLAGASCRVPLARRLLKDAFPSAQLIEDISNAKSKVAFGLVRYLDHLRFSDRARGIGLARDFSHAEIVWSAAIDHHRTWIPSCTPLGESPWFPLRSIRLADCWNSNKDRIIRVHRNTAPVLELLGAFDLKRPAESAESGVEPELPDGPIPDPLEDSPDAEGQVWLKLDGAEDRILLRVQLGDRCFGDWILTTPEAPSP